MPVPQVPMSVRGKKACSYTGGAHVKWSPLRQVQKLCFFVKKNIFLSFVLIFMYMHSCVCVPQVSILRHQAGYPVPWGWNCRQLWAIWHRCWKLNSGPLEKQQFLTTKPSVRSTTCFSHAHFIGAYPSQWVRKRHGKLWSQELFCF